MRTVHWLFIVGALLFVTGIGFVITGARAARQAPVADSGPVPMPVASVKQIMNGIVGPAATVVYGAVSTTVTFAGIEEKAPQTDEEWEAVGNSAAALIESGNLLLMGSRRVDGGDWTTLTQDLIAGSKLALAAVQAKSAEDLLAAGEPINLTCDTCHMKYQRGSAN